MCAYTFSFSRFTLIEGKIRGVKFLRENLKFLQENDAKFFPSVNHFILRSIYYLTIHV